jgi:hypothetical protein
LIYSHLYVLILASIYVFLYRVLYKKKDYEFVMKKMNYLKKIYFNCFKLFSLSTLYCFLHFFSFSAIITSNSSGDWSTGGTWVGGVAPVSTDDVIILTTHTITLTADAACDDLSIIGSGSLIVSSYNFTITGDSPGLSASIVTTCSSKLVINDSGSKTEFIIPSSITVLQKITLNRATGASCDHDLDLASCAPPGDSIVLVLTYGILSMNPIGTSKLLMGHTDNGEKIQVDIPCSDSSYVDGIVQRAIKGTGVYTFPVGNGGVCRRYGITQNSSVNESVHEVIFSIGLPRNHTCYSGGLAGGLLQSYSWYQVQVSGSNPQRRLYYQDSDFDLTAAQRLDLTLANGELASLATCPPATAPSNEWRTPTTGVTVYDGASEKFVQFNTANASNNPYWGFGSINAASPLPVGLIGIEVECQTDNFFDLVWSTSYEETNAYFSIEKSYDGNSFEEVGSVPGNGTSNEVNNYSYKMKASEDLAYLRIKQVDINGEEHFSSLVSASCKENSIVSFYPNPSSSYIYVTGLDGENTVAFFNVMNQMVYSVSLDENEKGISTMPLPNGVYFLKLNDNSDFLTEKLVVNH